MREILAAMYVWACVHAYLASHILLSLHLLEYSMVLDMPLAQYYMNDIRSRLPRVRELQRWQTELLCSRRHVVQEVWKFLKTEAIHMVPGHPGLQK